MSLGMLIKRTSLLEGESLPSYLLRLNHLNGYESMNVVYDLCRALPHNARVGNKSFLRPNDPAFVERAAALTGVDIDTLYYATTHRFATIITPFAKPFELFPLTSKMMSGVSRSVARLRLHPETACQWCPQCLAEEGYHRLEWALVVLSCCLKHNCLLQRGCPICQRDVSVSALVLGRCKHCGAEFAKTQAISVAHDTVGLQAQCTIAAWVGCAELPKDDLKLPPQSPRALFQALWSLWCVSMVTQTAWSYLHPSPIIAPLVIPSNGPSHKVEPALAYVMANTAFKALIDWPTGFDAFLEAYVRARPQAALGAAGRDFGSLYTGWVTKDWCQEGYRFLQEAFYSHVERFYGPSLSLIQLRRTTADRGYFGATDLICGEQASQLLHIAPESLERLTQFGVLERRVFQDDRVSRAAMYDQHEVEALKALWDSSITTKEVYRLTALPRAWVRVLLERGELHAERGPNIDGFYWRINTVSVDQFMQKIKGLTIPNPSGTMSLEQVLVHLESNGVESFQVMDALLCGSMRASWLDGTGIGTIRHLRFYAEDVQRLLPSVRPSMSHCSLRDARQNLGILRGLFQRLLTANLIHLDHTFTGRAFVHQSELERVKACLIFTKEASELLGVAMNSFSILSRTRFLREVWRLDSHTFDRAVFEAGVRDLIKAAEARQLLGVGQNLLCQWSQRFGLEHPWASKRQWVWFSRPRVLFLRAYLEQHGQKSARADGKRWLIDADCQAEIAALLCAVPRTSMGEVALLLPKKELIVQQEILQISFKSESVSLTQTQ